MLCVLLLCDPLRTLHGTPQVTGGHLNGAHAGFYLNKNRHVSFHQRCTHGCPDGRRPRGARRTRCGARRGSGARSERGARRSSSNRSGTTTRCREVGTAYRCAHSRQSRQSSFPTTTTTSSFFSHLHFQAQSKLMSRPSVHTHIHKRCAAHQRTRTTPPGGNFLEVHPGQDRGGGTLGNPPEVCACVGTPGGMSPRGLQRQDPPSMPEKRGTGLPYRAMPGPPQISASSQQPVNRPAQWEGGGQGAEPPKSSLFLPSLSSAFPTRPRGSAPEGHLPNTTRGVPPGYTVVSNPTLNTLLYSRCNLPLEQEEKERKREEEGGGSGRGRKPPSLLQNSQRPTPTPIFHPQARPPNVRTPPVGKWVFPMGKTSPLYPLAVGSAPRA